MTNEEQLSDASAAHRPYVADKTARRPTNEALRARIPGWGADLDPSNRTTHRAERPGAVETGAHWDLPERQADLHDRERSIEHGMLPPVFGTVAPLHGLSGLIRRAAYLRFSEARLAHWLLLIAGDRVDALGAHIGAVVEGHPGNPIAETGLRAELAAGREGRDPRRADRNHRWIDPILVTGPWLVSGWVAWRLVRGLFRRR